MLVGIITDLHSNIEATDAVFKALDACKPDQIVCLGDLVGYNTNPNEVADLIRSRKIPVVMGNHDAAVTGLESSANFNSRAQEAVGWNAEQLRQDNRKWLTKAKKSVTFSDICLGVHGSPQHRDIYLSDWMDAMQQFLMLDGTGIRVCFFGHTHRAVLFGEHSDIPTAIQASRCKLNPANRYLINPGSVGQPRDNDPRAAFGLLNTESMVFEFKRVEYDIEKTARKVLAAGLPESLAQRLFLGK